MTTDKYLQKFGRIVFHSLSVLELSMKELQSLQTSVTNYQSTCRNIPEDLDLRQHRPETPKLRIIFHCFLRVCMREKYTNHDCKGDEVTEE